MISLSAHSEHLKFMDIPIDGTIASFQSKLESKGIKVNSTKSKEAPNGQRIFEGKFQGYKSEITVFYNRKTKEVYKVEALINSKVKTDIEIILGQAISTIRNKYINDEEVDLHHPTGTYYQFHIKESITDSAYIGNIYVQPSNSVYIIGGGIADYLLAVIYEDYDNTVELVPSLTEPTGLWETFLRPEDFSKYMSWAEEYVNNEDYENGIKYYNYMLDYYRLNLPLDAIFNYENYLNDKIIELQSYKIGTIKTAYSEEYTDVFSYPYENGSFKCIRYDFFSSTYQVRLDRSEIKEQIETLQRLKQSYKTKKETSNSISHNNGYKEEITSLTMPATIGELNIDGKKGDFYGWKKILLSMHYSYWEDELRVIVKYKDKSIEREVLIFHDENDIDRYLNILKQIKI